MDIIKRKVRAYRMILDMKGSKERLRQCGVGNVGMQLFL